ncbi:MAG: hypothetical protein CVT59_04325 [Actinobacteria bacterium HGW-Actinobacteria-1]|jgi:NTE family protein|nr:MAG: hypothetical protein CVT59_04325 [Actinobacteria bacterium HGW-Actinobacteria-1]
MHKRLGLALGSGSARGLAHIGVLKVFEREGLPIDAIAGTSIGALIGGAYAVGVTPAEMERLAISVDFKHLVSLADVARPTTALVNGRHVEEFIRDVVDSQTFADVRIPFCCIAADVRAEREVVLRSGDLATAIRASVSTPVIFAPVERDDRLLVDGAVLNPVPVDAVRAMGVDTVVAVTNLGLPAGRVPSVSNDMQDPSIATGHACDRGFADVVYSRVFTGVMDRLRSPSVYQLASGSIDLMQRGLSEQQLSTADLIIAPQVDGAAYYSFFEADRIIRAGVAAAEAALPQIEALLEHAGTRAPARGRA